MRDLKLIVPDDPSQQWNLDFDIIDGYPVFLPYERNSQDQRAALSAYMVKGTIPGMPNEGINWAGIYEQSDETLVTIDNEIKQNIRNKAFVANSISTMYVPAYDITEDGIKLAIYQG